MHDITGMYKGVEHKHSKKYADLADIIGDCAKKYIEDVNDGVFPTNKNSFIVDDAVIEQLEKNF
jgi:3-methyl-2-oxobutanoate hydroxymethyltransferase